MQVDRSVHHRQEQIVCRETAEEAPCVAASGGPELFRRFFRSVRKIADERTPGGCLAAERAGPGVDFKFFPPVAPDLAELRFGHRHLCTRTDDRIIESVLFRLRVEESLRGEGFPLQVRVRRFAPAVPERVGTDPEEVSGLAEVAARYRRLVDDQIRIPAIRSLVGPDPGRRIQKRHKVRKGHPVESAERRGVEHVVQRIGDLHAEGRRRQLLRPDRDRRGQIGHRAVEVHLVEKIDAPLFVGVLRIEVVGRDVRTRNRGGEVVQIRLAR